MVEIILVQGFCPLKIKITQFPNGFCQLLHITDQSRYYCRNIKFFMPSSYLGDTI